MASASGRYVIIFNGEIYNHLDVRADLEQAGSAPDWRGHSDTETLLAAIDRWGLKATLQRCIGMFALALWDRRERELILARDRVGEKPLYYGWQGYGSEAAFLFGSELKALRAHPAFAGEIDRGALSLYMRHNSVPAPYSIYRGIHKLLPGCIATVSMARRDPVLEAYWSLSKVAEDGVADPLDLGPDEAVEALEALLANAVGQQMMSDVPLGAFLSGGIDSTTVVALMQAQASRPVKTFTIGNHDQGFDEAVYAREVAKHLGTDHTELYVSAEDGQGVIPLLSTMYDEPFADPSQIPTFLVSRLTRSEVTVALSGDAGDELFCGYNRYTVASGFWKSVSRMPRPLRSALSAGVRAVPPTAWNRLGSLLGPVTPRAARGLIQGDMLHKSARVLASRSLDDVYRGLVSDWSDPASVVIDGFEPPTRITGSAPPLQGLTSIERMMALDLLTYVPDDILVKVDRAAMAVSLETRVPFLDPRVIEFAWRMPFDYKLRDGQSKWPLRQILYRHVPREMMERPKHGFGVPIGDWLRGPLKNWAEDLLDSERLADQGYFRPEPIRQVWTDHQSGRFNKQTQLWNVLMFQAWLAETGETSASRPMNAAGFEATPVAA
jgi:asparagine synthase (glutamine-hydrolysing)